MLATDARLYLPISNEVLNDVLGSDEPLGDALAKLGTAQICCLIVIQTLYTKAGSPLPSPERMLSDTITVALNHSRRDGEAAFKSAAARILDRAKIQAGRELLPDAWIQPINDAEVGFRNYLLPDGSWNPTFCERYRADLAKVAQRVDLSTGGHRILTFEQSRIFLELKGHTDDHRARASPFSSERFFSYCRTRVPRRWFWRSTPGSSTR